ncbi:hypothetical protein CPB86DRAFT_630554 [Serendipita vermifera]|nr:hypothetical protein CPB86DRAFT_630554 [Serendipita vermifera]
MTQNSVYSPLNTPASSSVQSAEEARLSDLCWQLRSNITGIIQKNRGATGLDELKESYNRVIGALHDRKIRGRFDPMERLPLEIITKILLEASNANHRWFSSRDMEAVLSLTMVSRRWQNFILSEPLLWNTLWLENQYDGHAIISLQLQLSRDLPLILKAHFPPLYWDNWENILIELTKHRDRIETIECAKLFERAGSISRGCSNTLELLDYLGPLPNLRHLVAHSDWSSDLSRVNTILQRFPDIKQISGIPFTAHDLRSLGERKLNMHTLETCATPRTVLSMIGSLGNLQKITFIDDSPLSHQESGQEENSLEEPSLISPLEWTQLGYYQDRPKIFTCLPYCFYNLVVLDVTVDLRTLYDLLRCIYQFAKLSRVHIVVFPPYNGETLPPSDICANMRVQSLEFSITSSRWFDASDTTGESGQILQIMQLPRLLHHAMPKTASYRLTIYDWPQLFPTFLVGEWFIGEELWLKLIKCSFKTRIDIQIPCLVKSLTLDILGHMDLIPYFSSSFLKSLLLLRGWLPEEKMPPTNSQTVNLDSWPALESISIETGMVQWGKYSLDFLRRVDIIEVESDLDLECRVTSFIRELAYCPNSYPSLEEIKLNECPEWDILVIMLERRNLLAGPSIQRIQNLKFPSLFPQYIFRIIRDLL